MVRNSGAPSLLRGRLGVLLVKDNQHIVDAWRRTGGM